MSYTSKYLRSWSRKWSTSTEWGGNGISNFNYWSLSSLGDSGLEGELSDGEVGIVRSIDDDDELADIFYTVTDSSLIFSYEVEEDETAEGTITYLSKESSALRDKFSGVRSYPPTAEDYTEDEDVYTLPGTGGPGTGLSTAPNTVGETITSAYDALVLKAQTTEITAAERFRTISITTRINVDIASTISGSTFAEAVITPIRATQGTS